METLPITALFTINSSIQRLIFFLSFVGDASP